MAAVHESTLSAPRPGGLRGRRLCVAPMMQCTDRHDRYLLRLISRHALLFTEMIPCGALLHGDRRRFLAFDPAEHPVALQLGGSEPAEMAACARMAQAAGYDEVNVNVGCPSSRVSAGRFGACLMAEPERVARCVEAMNRAVDIPVTVKTRIGVDARDSFEELCAFVATVAAAGCGTFVIHARKAWLKGLSPRQNREVPPLDYTAVHGVKAEFPELEIVINGGIRSLEAARAQLARVDGAMIGRAAYENPYLLARADALFFGDPHPVASRREILQAYAEYVRRELGRGVYLRHMTRHLFGLFQGCPGARRWRRHLSEAGARADAGAEVIEQAYRHVAATGSSRGAVSEPPIDSAIEGGCA